MFIFTNIILIQFNKNQFFFMGRSIIHLFTISILVSVLYLFGKTKQYYFQYFPQNYNIKLIKSNSGDSIITQNDSVIIPVNYSGSIDFKAMDPELRKKKFIEYLLPAIVVVREKLLDELHHLEFIEQKVKNKIPIHQKDSVFLFSMIEKYKTDSIIELKKRIFPHPISLALTQAALESGWGTSIICMKGHNLFGVLSFSAEESRLKMRFNNTKEDIYLRTYEDVIQSVEHYFLLISRVSSYKKFREKRWEGASPKQLLKLLDSYHEADEYEELAKSIMIDNELIRYDLAYIDPNYRERNSLYSFLTQH